MQYKAKLEFCLHQFMVFDVILMSIFSNTLAQSRIMACLEQNFIPVVCFSGNFINNLEFLLAFYAGYIKVEIVLSSS